jgi:hypothetical protein
MIYTSKHVLKFFINMMIGYSRVKDLKVHLRYLELKVEIYKMYTSLHNVMLETDAIAKYFSTQRSHPMVKYIFRITLEVPGWCHSVDTT